jgi:RHS repeat-associated protein
VHCYFVSDKRKRVELGSESSLADKDGDGYIEPFNVNPTEPNGGTTDASVDLTDTEVYQETHYYPFGMTMEGEWQNIVNGPENNYLYNGKELNSDFGLDWSDYGARYYDASIGRWNSVDPLAELFPSQSPYNYTFNNPIRFTDPSGMAPEDNVSEDRMSQRRWDDNRIYGKASFDTPPSTHVDEDGNEIASFDDGDNSVYEHSNGTTKQDIESYNYYESGNTGTRVTDGGGTQIAGIEVTVTARKYQEVLQVGLRATFIVGIGITTSRGKLIDDHGNVNDYVDFGFGWGLDIGFGGESVVHSTTSRIPYEGDAKFGNSNIEGYGVMHSYSAGPQGGNGQAKNRHNFEHWGHSYKTNSDGVFQSKLRLGYSNTSSKLFITK